METDSPYQIYGTLRHDNEYFILQIRFTQHTWVVWYLIQKPDFQTFIILPSDTLRWRHVQRAVSPVSRLRLPQRNMYQPPLSLMLSGVMEDFCAETRYCYGVKRKRIHLHYSPSLRLAILCLHWKQSVCVVSTATDTDGLSLTLISNHFQITVRTVCPYDWIRNKK